MNEAIDPDHYDLYHLLANNPEPILLLADCRTESEQQVLERWIEGNSRGASVDTHLLRVNMKAPSEETYASLQRNIESMPAGTRVVPVRVLWLPAIGDRRFRDIILGNPHNPGALMQKLLLRFAPERCTPVYGEPASLEELRRDFDAQSHAASLGEFTLRRAVLALKQVERKLRLFCHGSSGRDA